MNKEIIMAAFVAVESAHAYSAFEPSIFTIRTFGHEPTTTQAIRDGEIMGSVFALALGGIVSALTESYLPLIFAVGTVVFMVSIYEWALQTREQT